MTKDWLDLPTDLLAAEEAAHMAAGRKGVGRVGVACSGGGIRSACFNLGVLQALDEKDLLSRVDYLSTVSGGGYVGSWLVSCLREDPGFRPSREGKEIDHLRRYARYLSPESGFFSADTWTMASIWLRNTTLLQVTLCCFLGCLLLLPRLWHLAFAGWSGGTASQVAVPVLLGIAMVAIWNQLIAAQTGSRRGAYQGVVQVLIACPVLAAAGLGAAYHWNHPDSVRALVEEISGVIAIASAAATVLSWDRKSLKDTWPLAIPGCLLIGIACGGLFFGLLTGMSSLFANWLGSADAGVWYAATWGAPLLMLSLTAVVVLLIGLAGRQMPDSVREWWSRLGAWLSIYSLAALLLGLAGVFGPLYLFKLYGWADGYVATGGGVMAVVVTLVGLFFGKGSETGKEGAAGWKEILAAVAPYLFIVLLIVGLATLLHAGFIAPDLQEHATKLPWDPNQSWPTVSQYISSHWTILDYASKQRLGGFPMTCILFIALGLLAVVFAWRVDLNEFSMNHFYRNRLVRCFMGAARAGVRKPNWFTGFDFKDDYPISKLRPTDGQHPYKGPLPIVNTALNLTGEGDATVEERRATSFFVTPYRAGSHLTGYKGSEDFGDTGGGFKLGAAVATSGAAASPNMGFHTSAAIAFLLTFFNVRLGWWVPNPGRPSGRYSPRFGLFYLLKELFGTATGSDNYIYLSDGGHFENLGAYELVRRRCKWIVIGDGEQDGNYAFESLGGLVRKCWTDLGVTVDVPVSKIRKAPGDEYNPARFVLGTINYQGDQEPRTGHILYIKSSLGGAEPPDVLQYHYQHKDFPHETTADQFFSESQFESYRKLGRSIAGAALNDVEVQGVFKVR